MYVISCLKVAEFFPRYSILFCLSFHFSQLCLLLCPYSESLGIIIAVLFAKLALNQLTMESTSTYVGALCFGNHSTSKNCSHSQTSKRGFFLIKNKKFQWRMVSLHILCSNYERSGEQKQELSMAFLQFLISFVKLYGTIWMKNL